MNNAEALVPLADERIRLEDFQRVGRTYTLLASGFDWEGEPRKPEDVMTADEVRRALAAWLEMDIRHRIIVAVTPGSLQVEDRSPAYLFLGADGDTEMGRLAGQMFIDGYTAALFDTNGIRFSK